MIEVAWQGATEYVGGFAEFVVQREDRIRQAEAAAANQDQFMRQLKQTFEKLPHEIPIYMFVERGRDDIFAQTNRQIVRAFRELTSKITFREHQMDHELARKWEVDRSPTLLIAPERVNIRWIGAPLGEEGRTFLETLIFIGLGKSNLNDQTLKVLKKIDTPRRVKVFVSATCQHDVTDNVISASAKNFIPQFLSTTIVGQVHHFAFLVAP